MDQNGRPLRELTFRVIFFGALLSMLLSAATAYLGLFAGMTISAAIPAAVMSLGILRFFRNTIIQENNLIGTCASAGESLAAGVIFTLPALLMLGFWTEFSYVWVAVISACGGTLGVLFTVPLRRSLIVEGNLKFPEGIATAKVLETGRSDPSGIKYLARAAIAGGLFKAGARGVFGLWPEVLEGAKRIGGTVAYCGTNLSPALLSVGYIVGLNIAVLMVLGGAANWFVAIPVVAAQNDWPVYRLKSELTTPVAWNTFVLEYKTSDQDASPEVAKTLSEHNDKVRQKIGKPVEAGDYAKQIWSAKTRYIGVGGMLVGGLWTIFRLRKSLAGGITSGLKAYRNLPHERAAVARTEKDIPMNWVLIGILALVVPMFLIYLNFVGRVSISVVMALIMVFAGFLFAAVAGYMAGLVGSSNNPISGVTIATVLVSAVLLFLMMRNGPEEFVRKGPAFAVIIGGVICCAAAIAGDVMQDLKCGRIIGTTPWKQQTIEIIGVLAAALVIPPVLMLLHKAYGFEGMPGVGKTALSAPQASLMSSVSQGVFGGGLPWTFVLVGVGIAFGIIALDAVLQKTSSSFRVPVLAVAIGFYLRLEMSVPIFMGGLAGMIIKRYLKRRNASEEQLDQSERKGLLFASGLITGEALMGIVMAIPIIVFQQLKINTPLLGYWDKPSGTIVGTGLFLCTVLWLFRITTRRS